MSSSRGDEICLLDDIGGQQPSSPGRTIIMDTELQERTGSDDASGAEAEEQESNCETRPGESNDGEDKTSVAGSEPEANGVVVAEEVVVTVAEKKKKHFFLVRWICSRPCLMFWLALTGHVLFVAITFILYYTDYNILPLYLEDMPIFNLHDLTYRRNLAWLQREKAYPVFLFNAQYPSKRKRRSTNEDPYPPVDPEDINSVRLHLMYEVGNHENVFTSRRLDAIKKFEKAIVAPFKKGAKRASPAHYACGEDSVLSIFDANLTHIRENVTNDIWHIGPYIGKDGIIDNVTGAVTSRYARSFVTLCWTYTFYNISTWSVDEVNTELIKQEKIFLEPQGITLFYWNYRSFSELVFRQANHDILYFIGSVLFIFVFMWMQTSSLFVTIFGTGSILTSFVGGNLIYNCIIGYEYLGLFNILALFIVLGIGADDIFVFFDTWKSLEHLENMEDRMASTFRRAGAAMFTTSFSTMAAFFVSSFSQVLPISSFGTFAGVTVFVNYMSVITFFPTVVAVYHCYYERCCLRKSDSYSFKESSKPGSNRVYTAVSNFFKNRYYAAVTHRIGKWILITAFVLLFAGMLYSCATVKLDQRTYLKAFKGENVLEVGLEKTAFNYKLGAEDKMVTVQLVWGIGARNMSQCNRLKYINWRPCSGDAVHDEAFSLESPESQLAMLNVCRNLTHIQEPLRSELKLQQTENGTNKVFCFMEYFDKFLRTITSMLNESSILVGGRKVDLKVPLKREDIEPLMPLLGAFVGLKLNASAMVNPVQTTMAIFIEKNATDLKEYVGFKSTETEIGTYQNGTPVFDQQVKYAAILVPLTEQVIRIKVDEGLRLQDKWEEYTEESVKNMPAGLDKGWQVAGSWFLARQKKDLMYRALSGVAISLTLAFAVLLLTTRNFILAILAEVTLVGAVTCVVGVLPLAGWEFGLLESINVCFVAGLAVDYIVHVVEAYSMSGCKTSKDRTKDALARIGVSVLSGAVTTLGASFFMFFSGILFFLQFGTFIFCTVGFSLIFALLFFPAVLDTFGPSGDVGSFGWIFRKCRRGCRRTSKDLQT